MNKDLSSREEWRRSWTVVLAAFMGVSLFALPIYSFGVFLLPVATEFGWSNSQTAASITIVSFMLALLSPFGGRLIDAYGSRRIGLTGVTVLCSAFGLLSLTPNNVVVWWVLWCLVGIGMILVSPMIWTAPVVSRFVVSRGLALAVTFSGIGVGTMLAPLICNALIEKIGWRDAYACVGAIWFVAVAPVLWLLLPKFVDGPSRTAHARLNRLVFSPAFAKLALSSALTIFAVGAMVVYFVPILMARSLPSREAAIAASIIGVASITGRLITGLLLDRFPPRAIGAVMFLLPAFTALALLFFDGSFPMAVGCAAVFGLAIGAEIDIAGFLVSSYFGVANYGVLFGVIIGLNALGNGLGPLFGGVLHDVFASYDPLLIAIVPVSFVASLLIATLPANLSNEGLVT